MVMAATLMVGCENGNQASKASTASGTARCLTGMEMGGKYIVACDGDNQALKVSVECFNKASQSSEQTTLKDLRSNGCLGD